MKEATSVQRPATLSNEGAHNGCPDIEISMDTKSVLASTSPLSDDRLPTVQTAIIDAPATRDFIVKVTPGNAEVRTEAVSPTKPKEKNKKLSNLFIPAAEPDPEGSDLQRIRLGICALDKKARSKPMANILSRLDAKLFRVVFFGDDVIRNQPVEDWPSVDVLIAFYSTGYPLDKAKEYARLRKPVILNDLSMQSVIMDRRQVYDLLEESGIDVPRHVYLSRDGYVSNGTGNGTNDQELEEHDDHIIVNGIQINKPFVEKPVDADDHNISIYYPTSAGGGCKKLFRKIGNRSSEFYPDINEVRQDGSFIYEEFVETQGTDVKMYTVGPEYGHAEARKSPTVDGKVERNSEGKEIRFPVILTVREKEIARRIVLGFKQFVCGFDLLRVQEGDTLVSYVCDVNGWSFVKNSRKYYDDCAQILTEHMLATFKPKLLHCFSTMDPMVKQTPDTPVRSQATSALQRVTRLLTGDIETKLAPPPETISETASILDGSVSAATTLVEGAVPVREIPDTLTSQPASMNASSSSSQTDEPDMKERKESVTDMSKPGFHQEELRCVIAVVRHGDRTPKQKLKINTSEPRILDYFHTHNDNYRKDLKVKAKTPMIEFLETVKLMILEKKADYDYRLDTDKRDILNKLMHMRDVLERWKISGLNRKLQIKPRDFVESEDENGDFIVRATKVQLILKWGGNLTKLGERQSINLGQNLRHVLYPDAPGGGILRLHSTFRHDLKIKTSDEGRVMKTAAAFAKGLLELEGEIPPILVSLVHKEKESIHMLDPSGNNEVKLELDACKDKVNVNLQRDFEYSETSIEEHEELVGPTEVTSLHEALAAVGNPRKTLFKLHESIGQLLGQLDDMLGVMASGEEDQLDGEGLQGDENTQALSGVKLYKGETLLELTERWRFIYSRMYDEEKDMFDLSRIPDVHDNVRFDMLHNPHLGLTASLEKLYNLAKILADCVVPQEYGTTIEEKRSIGHKMCGPLVDKMKCDLVIARTDNQIDMRYMINMEYSNEVPIATMGRRIRTRLYFTSESHLHTLLNVLRFGGSEGADSLLSEEGRKICASAPELCYLTQIVFRLFEDTKRDPDDPKRYRVEILFSPGATATPMHMAELDRDSDSSRFDCDPLQVIGRDDLSCHEVEEFLTQCISEGTTEDDKFEMASVCTTVDEMRRKSRLLSNASAETTVHDNLSSSKHKEEEQPEIPNEAPEAPLEITMSLTDMVSDGPTELDEIALDLESKEENEDDVEQMARILSRRWYWRTIAFGSFVLGAGCLFFAMNINEPQYRRRYSRK